MEAAVHQTVPVEGASEVAIARCRCDRRGGQRVVLLRELRRQQRRRSQCAGKPTIQFHGRKQVHC